MTRIRPTFIFVEVLFMLMFSSLSLCLSRRLENILRNTNFRNFLFYRSFFFLNGNIIISYYISGELYFFVSYNLCHFFSKFLFKQIGIYFALRFIYF